MKILAVLKEGLAGKRMSESSTLLTKEDLMLIRKGFMEMAIREKYSGDVGRARESMKRILRRAK